VNMCVWEVLDDASSWLARGSDEKKNALLSGLVSHVRSHLNA